jgi:hypothetical protein
MIYQEKGVRRKRGQRHLSAVSKENGVRDIYKPFPEPLRKRDQEKRVRDIYQPFPARRPSSPPSACRAQHQ